VAVATGGRGGEEVGGQQRYKTPQFFYDFFIYKKFLKNVIIISCEFLKNSGIL
jgi:hypothetical protein